jgi:DNA modification methylase
MKRSVESEWSPSDFSLESTTIWDFPNRGSWATHESAYRGNWSPYVPRNLILRYSQEGDLILDQFVGSGTTLIEAKLLNRESIGIDINPYAVTLSQKKSILPHAYTSEVSVMVGDARCLSTIESDSIDLICTHPPYANAIQYSENLENDLSRLHYSDFLEQMKKVAAESIRVLKSGKYCSILIGDIRKHGSNIPLGFYTMDTFLSQGFKLKEIIIKEQHNCKSTGFWKQKSKKYNFLLLAHEYLFVFKK